MRVDIPMWRLGATRPTPATDRPGVIDLAVARRAKSRARYRLAAAVLLAVAALPAAEIPESLIEAMDVIGSVRRAVAEFPVLTGSEDFDLEAFRQSLIDLRGGVTYSNFLTANDVTDLVASAGTYSGHLAYFDIGWAALEINWVYATLLGESDTAAALQRECNWLLGQHPLYVANVTSQSAYSVFANLFPRNEASGLAMLLRQSAAQANLAAYIPEAADPEGFVRRRLQGVFERLTNSADLIRDAGEAYSLY